MRKTSEQIMKMEPASLIQTKEMKAQDLYKKINYWELTLIQKDVLQKIRPHEQGVRMQDRRVLFEKVFGYETGKRNVNSHNETVTKATPYKDYVCDSSTDIKEKYRCWLEMK